MYQPNLDCQGSPNVSDELELDEVEGLLVLKWTCDRVAASDPTLNSGAYS